jgi:hypothetical protein
MIFIYHRDVKTLKITGFGALDGQIQHVAAQKVGFTPRLLRQVALIFGLSNPLLKRSSLTIQQA